MSLSIPPFEYRLQGIGISLEFVGVSPEEIDETTWAYKSGEVPDKIGLSLSAELPSDWLTLFPEAERLSPPVQAYLSVESVSVRDRKLYPLTRSDAKFNGQIEISTKELGGALGLRVIACRAAQCVHDAPNLAKRQGSILATSHERTIYLNGVPEQKGGDIRTLWKSFSDLDAPASEFSNALYWLDLQPEVPVLYLNELLPEDLRAVLSSMKTKGKQAETRDTFMKPIVADVWEQLINSSIIALKELQNPELLEGWQKRVLATAAQGLTLKVNADDAYAELCEACNEGHDDELAKIMSRLPLYVQVKSDLRGTFNKMALAVVSTPSEQG